MNVSYGFGGAGPMVVARSEAGEFARDVEAVILAPFLCGLTAGGNRTQCGVGLKVSAPTFLKEFPKWPESG